MLLSQPECFILIPLNCLSDLMIAFFKINKDTRYFESSPTSYLVVICFMREE